MAFLSRRQVLGSGALAWTAGISIAPAVAQPAPFPSKPVLVKVAFPAGGPADASIRAAAVVLQRELAQTIVIDNMPGANGSLASMFVSKATADGYTLLGITGVDFLVAPFTMASAKYLPTDFQLLGLTGYSDFALVSSPKHSFASVDELLSHARKPGGPELSCGHWGTGSAPHLVAADFQARTGVKLLDVPYKGAAPALADLAGGQVDLTFVPLGGPTVGMIQSGKIKVIGIASTARSLALSAVPALAENPQLRDFNYGLWAALFAPPKLPDALTQRLNEAMNRWLISPENQVRVSSHISKQLDPMTPDQANAFLKSEHDKFNRLARSLKLQPQ